MVLITIRREEKRDRSNRPIALNKNTALLVLTFFGFSPTCIRGSPEKRMKQKDFHFTEITLPNKFGNGDLRATCLILILKLLTDVRERCDRMEQTHLIEDGRHHQQRDSKGAPSICIQCFYYLNVDTLLNHTNRFLKSPRRIKRRPFR